MRFVWKKTHWNMCYIPWAESQNCGHLRAITSCSKMSWNGCTSGNSYRKHLSNGDPNWGHQLGPKSRTLQLLPLGRSFNSKTANNQHFWLDSELLNRLGPDYSMCGPKVFKCSTFKIVTIRFACFFWVLLKVFKQCAFKNAGKSSGVHVIVMVN